MSGAGRPASLRPGHDHEPTRASLRRRRTDRLSQLGHARGAGGPRASGGALRRRPGRGGQRDRGAWRRRPHAADAPRVHGRAQADLRDEPRLGRLPDERVPGGRPARAARRRVGLDHPSAGDDGDGRARRHVRGAGDQRSVHAAPVLPGGEAAHPHRRAGAHARAHRRWPARVHAGWLDGLQPVGERADPAARIRR